MTETDLSESEESNEQLPKDRLQLVLLWLVGAVGACLLYNAFSGYVFEDAYITYRYAENVAKGIGYVFNEGEHVFGATSPLHTLSLALCSYLGADVPTAASVMYAVGLGLVGVFGGLIIRHFGSPNAAVLFALLVVSGAGRTFWCWGLETPVMIALVLAGSLAAIKKHDRLAAIIAGLAFLTRYDGALFAITLFGLMLIRRRKMPWGPGLIATAIVLPWLVFAQFYFGSVMPNTLAAKMGEYRTFEYMRVSGIGQLTAIWRPMFEVRVSPFKLTDMDIYVGGAIAAGMLVGLARYLHKNLMLALILLHPLALWLGYSYIGPPAEFAWYLIPAAFPLVVLGFVGFGGMFPRGALVKFRGIAVAVIAIGYLIWVPNTLESLREDLVQGDGYKGRVGAYETIGDWLIEHDLTEERLLCTEPGYLTYRTGNPVIDAAGLVTKGVFLHGNHQRRSSISGLLEERDPPLAVVSMPISVEGYVPVFNAFPHKFLMFNRALHRENFKWIQREFYSTERDPELLEPVSHPFHWDIERGIRKVWLKAGGKLGIVMPRKRLHVDAKPYDELVLGLVANRTGCETPPFVIDFDRLAFRFAGTNSRATLAQLIIDDHVVFEQAGHEPSKKRSDPIAFRHASWPVGHWRGLTASLRFVHVGWQGREWIAADHIRSVVSEDKIQLDDFESTEGYSDFWEETFGEKPTELATIAPDFGVEYGFSKGAALSLGVPGKVRMVSKPFVVERDYLNMILFDHSQGHGTAVQLLVDGQVVRKYEPLRLRRMRPITWKVAGLRGREAVLQVLDNRPGGHLWIGIDDVNMTNE